MGRNGNLTIDLANSGGCWNTPLDNFMYSVLVPEPSGLTLVAIGLIGVLVAPSEETETETNGIG